MKKYLQAFFMAFGMFTSIPCPYRPWNDEARPLMILFFPIIGVILGALWFGAWILFRYLGFPSLLTAALMTILPYALSGFLHLDGYMDVCDAVLSRRGLEERQRILKDPHVGSFAVIMICCLFLVNFSLFASVDANSSMLILILLPAAVRCCAGAAVTLLRPMQTSQYSGTYRTNAKTSHVIILLIMFCLCIAGGYLLDPWRGAAILGIGSAVYWLSVLWGSRNLRGMNGDISGFGLVLGELAGIAALVFIGG